MHQLSDSKKVKIAFLVSPLISCTIGLIGILIFALLTSNFSGLSAWPGTQSFIKQSLHIFLSLLVMAYLITLLFGIPCYLLLKRLDILNLFTLLLSAYFISNISLILPSLVSNYNVASLMNRQFLIFVLLCPLHLITLLGAFCFWWIAVRPGQDMVITHKIPSDKAVG